jgi:hypothetical protein
MLQQRKSLYNLIVLYVSLNEQKKNIETVEILIHAKNSPIAQAQYLSGFRIYGWKNKKSNKGSKIKKKKIR